MNYHFFINKIIDVAKEATDIQKPGVTNVFPVARD